MKARIFYPNAPDIDQRHAFSFPDGKIARRTKTPEYYVLWEGEVEAADNVGVCEHLFEVFNIGDRFGVKHTASGLGCRSMSVGDMVEVNGTTYRCASFGWEETTAPTLTGAERFGE